MDARLNLFDNPVAGKFLKYLTSANNVVSDSTLPAATQELVRLRASQINGCGFCTDMHTKDAAHAGETSLRLNLVAGGVAGGHGVHRSRARCAGADGAGHPHRRRGRWCH